MILTSPVLVLAPSAIVSLRFALTDAPESGGTDTVTVTASLVARVSRTLTWVSPPFSGISSAVSSRITVGGGPGLVAA